MTIYRASELKDQLMEHLVQRHEPVALDLSGVTEFDTAGLQLLLMARRLCAASARKFVLKDPSATVRETIMLCGLDHLMLGTDAQA